MNSLSLVGSDRAIKPERAFREGVGRKRRLPRNKRGASSGSTFIWSVADLLRGDYKRSDYGRRRAPNDSRTVHANQLLIVWRDDENSLSSSV